MIRKSLFVLIICNIICINSRLFDYITIKIYRHDTPLTVLRADSINNEVNVTEILIEEEHVPVLKSGSFQSLKILEKLFVQRNNIEAIEQYAFYDLPSLKIINLNFNTIKKITRNIFANLTVRKISLKGNGISELESWSFYNLTFLSTLDISSNNITSLPRELFQMTRNLRMLDLSWNDLTAHFGIPTTYSYTYLEEPFWNIMKDENSLIDLSFNQIDQIDPDMFQGLIGVKTLLLNYNNITRINEKAFTNFLFLEKIELEGNNLENLKDSVLKSLEKVKDINLAYNSWSDVFICKYYYWCGAHEKNNTIENNCTLTY